MVDVDGTIERCHVKNTGRCREILTEGATVVLETAGKERKTKYDLIAVYKNDMLINIDSQAPNRAFHEYLLSSRPVNGIEEIRPEFTHGDSRFDFFVKADGKKMFMEVKGVTLEEDGIALFPDAPTERGLKHVRELMKAVNEGYDAYIVFVIQMKHVAEFTPNRTMHPEFADAVKEAAKKGVNVIALDCIVTENSMVIDSPVRVIL